MKLQTLLLGALLAGGLATAASAETYDFSYVSDNGGDTAHGQLTTDGSGNVTSGFGLFNTVGAGAISAVISPGAGGDGSFNWDNLLPVDNAGLLFSDGSNEVNIFTNGAAAGVGSTPLSELYVSNPPGSGGYQVGDDGTLTIAVPEPATWALMLVGFGAIGGGLRVARRKQAAVA